LLKRTPKWPFQTAEKRKGLESQLKCGEAGRLAAALHIASAYRYAIFAAFWDTSKRLKNVWFFGGVLDQQQKGICGRCPERTPMVLPSASWHGWATSDFSEPDIGR